MIKSNSVRTIIEKLESRIKLAKQGKNYILYIKNKLEKKYREREITQDQYLWEYEQPIDGRTITEWIHYYDSYIRYCQYEIRRHKKTISNKNILTIFLSMVFIFTLSWSLFYIGPLLGGFVVQDINSTNLTEDVLLLENISDIESISGNMPAIENTTDEIIEENITIEEPLNISSDEQNITEIITNETFIEENETLYLNESITKNITEELSKGVTITTTQLPTVLGRPVKWKKHISLDKAKKIKIDLPSKAVDISVKKIKENKDIKFTITGEVISDVDNGNFIARFFENLFNRFKKNFSMFTGRVVQEIEDEINQSIEIGGTATEYEVTYETPAPYAIEESRNYGKWMKVVGLENVRYENVTSFTLLEDSLNVRDPSEVKIYWIEEDRFLPIEKIEDKDNNGFYDYVEWIIPHLSNQTFQIIIEVTRVEHLDENREFISDIYDEVSQLDGVWSEVISAGHYVRVTFEIPLDGTRDIILYPNVVSGSPRIEVYEKGGIEVIAEFANLNSNEYNKIYLTSLVGEQDTFDLLVLDGEIEIDHILDPDWFNSSWSYRKNITIDHTKVNGTQTNFPVLINITDTDLKDDAQADGDDIIFTNLTGSQLDHEIEHYNSTTGWLVAWVRVPSLSGSVNTTIQMYYGNAGASNRENASRVWDSDYKMIHHMKDDVLDSVQNSNGTKNNMEAGVDGQIYKAQELNANDEYISFDDNAIWTFTPITENRTVSFWFKTSSVPNVDGEYQLYFDGQQSGYRTYRVTLANNGGTNLLAGLIQEATGEWGSLGSFYFVWTPNTNQWYYIVANFEDDGNSEIWVDGVSQSITHYSWDDNAEINPNASKNSDGSAIYDDYVQDELRLSHIARSGGWIKTSYNNQNSPSTFCSIGSEEAVPDTTNPQINFTSPTPTNDTTTTNTSIEINVSIIEANLEEVKFNWNGTNYTIYNDSLVLMMNFDNVSALGENDDLVKDVSSYGNNGAIVGAVFNSGGKFGGAYEFDGVNDYINVKNDTSLNISESYTIMSWVYPLSFVYSPTIVMRANGSGNNELGVAFNTDGQAIFATNDHINYSGTTFSLNQWHHIVAVRNKNTDRKLLYVDGKSYINESESALFEYDGDFYIGVDTDLVDASFGNYFNGTIDEVAIWNRSLSAEEISQMYMSNLNKYDTDKWLLYVNQSNNATASLDDGTYTYQVFAKDDSGNENVTGVRSVTVDTTAPTYSLNQTNNTLAGQSTLFSIQYNDSVALHLTGQYIFSTNNSGSWVNDSAVNWTTTPSWANVTKTLNSTSGISVGYRWYADDNSGNWDNTGVFVLTTGVGNTAPQIIFVESISAQDPSEGGIRTITFNFTANDTGGATDLNPATAQARFQKAGEITRLNTSCIELSASGNEANYSCTIEMWYFDDAGAWTINVTIQDDSGASAENSSTTFTYNLLTAMVMSPTALTWGTMNLIDIDLGSNNDPIVVNNTGNVEGLSINITGYDLAGTTTTTDYIYANNFTVDNATEGCSGTAMSNSSDVTVSSLTLERGNNSLALLNATSGQEQLFFCLKGIPQDISSQDYSSGAWMIRIFLVLLTPVNRKRKRNIVTLDENVIGSVSLILDNFREKHRLGKMEVVELLVKWIRGKNKGGRDKLARAACLILENAMDEHGLSDIEIMNLIVEAIRKRYGISRKAVQNIEGMKVVSVPVTIFSKKIGGLEALTKYMRENLGMSYSKIGEELNRDQRTIWTAYNKTKNKQKEIIKTNGNELSIPMKIFADRKLTVLMAVIAYFKNNGMKYSEIGKLLNRDQRNIWTIYSNTMKNR